MDVCENGYDCADARPAGSSRLVLYSLFNSARKTLEIFRRLEPSDTGRSSSVDFLAEKPGFDDSVHWPSAQCLSLFSKRVQYRVFSSVTMTALISSLQYINAHDALVAKMLGDSVAATASPIPLVMDARTTRGILNSPLWRLTASRCNDAAGSDSGIHVDDGSLAVYSDQTSQLLQWSFIIAGGARIAESESELGDEKVITCAARFIEDMHFICASSSTNEFVRGALWSVDSPFRLAHRTLSSSSIGECEPCGKCKACFASLPGFGSPTPFTSTPVNVPKTPSRRRAQAKPTRAAETVALQVDDDVWQEQDGSRPYKKKISSAMDVDYGDEYEDDDDDDDDDDEELEEDDNEEYDAEELETIDEEDDEEADDDDASSTSDAHNVVIEVEEDGEYDLTDGEEDDDEDASDDEEKVRAYAYDDEDE